jgi:hypothetical protein
MVVQDLHQVVVVAVVLALDHVIKIVDASTEKKLSPTYKHLLLLLLLFFFV